MASRLCNKVVVVTGSSSGIGRSIAIAFASQGAKLVVCADIQPNCYDIAETVPASEKLDDSRQPTHEIVCRLRGLGTGIFVRCDISLGVEEKGASLDEVVRVREEGMDRVRGVHVAIEEAVRMGGRLDVLVNSAEIAVLDIKLHATPEAEWDKAMSVHARGTFLGSKYATIQFLSQDLDSQGERGTIINISSVAGGLVGVFECSAYCASKAAIVGLTRAVAVDYASRGIRCNAICPGYVNPTMLAPFLANPDFASYLDTMIPARRIGKPRDVTGAAVWLASGEESGYVNGIVLPIDGGFTAR